VPWHFKGKTDDKHPEHGKFIVAPDSLGPRRHGRKELPNKANKKWKVSLAVERYSQLTTTLEPGDVALGAAIHRRATSSAASPSPPAVANAEGAGPRALDEKKLSEQPKASEQPKRWVPRWKRKQMAQQAEGKPD